MSIEEQKLYRKRLAARLRQRRCRARKRLAFPDQQQKPQKETRQDKFEIDHSNSNAKLVTKHKQTLEYETQKNGENHLSDERKRREIAILGMLELSGKNDYGNTDTPSDLYDDVSPYSRNESSTKNGSQGSNMKDRQYHSNSINAESNFFDYVDIICYSV